MLGAAILGALGGGPGYRAIDSPRDHPYTSLDAADMEAALDGRIRAASARGLGALKGVKARLEMLAEKHEKRMDRMEARNNATAAQVAELPPDTLLERVTRVEEKLKHLEQTCLRWAPEQLEQVNKLMGRPK